MLREPEEMPENCLWLFFQHLLHHQLQILKTPLRFSFHWWYPHSLDFREYQEFFFMINRNVCTFIFEEYMCLLCDVCRPLNLVMTWAHYPSDVKKKEKKRIFVPLALFFKDHIFIKDNKFHYGIFIHRHMVFGPYLLQWTSLVQSYYFLYFLIY